jgi:raffinose/stachyose/melibiose transport system substrate-binding protein
MNRKSKHCRSCKSRMQTIRKSLMLGILMPLIAGIAACGRMNEGENFVNEEVPANPAAFSITYAMGDPAHQKGIQTVINDYKKSHLNIQITVLENNQQAKGYADDLVLLDAMDNFPDLVEMRDTQMFADAGLLAELPEGIRTLFDGIPQVNGKIYTAPLKAEMPQGIIYNQKIFRQLGLGEPANYQEFLDLCETIRRSGVSPLIVGGKDLWHMGFWINHFLMDEVYSKDPEWNRKRSAGQVSWTDPAPLQAMQELKDLWVKDYVLPGFMNVSDSQTIGYLTSGKAAMLMSGPWMFKQLEQADPEFELGFFPVPDRRGGFHIVGLPQPSGWSISSSASDDPEKLKVIEQFLQFFYSAEEYPKYLEAVSALPATLDPVPYLKSELLQEAAGLLKNPDVTKLRSMDNYWGEDQIPPGFRNAFYAIMQSCLSGNISVDEAMAQADRAWDLRNTKD